MDYVEGDVVVSLKRQSNAPIRKGQVLTVCYTYEKDTYVRVLDSKLGYGIHNVPTSTLRRTI